MARIPDVEVERLKREVSLQRLVEARGVELKRHGADLLGLCPFHEDKTPSLVVTPSKNLWHCLGACQSGGSVVDWVMRAEGVSFRHAVELLRSDMPLAGGAGRVVKASTVRRLPAPVAMEGDELDALEQVAAYYHQRLKESPEALAYLKKRGLHSAEAIEHFRLGFADRTLGLRLPEKNRRAGAQLRERLQRLGVMRESGHEHLAGSLVVPLCNAEGRVVGMYGRKVTANLRPGTPLHLYLPGPHRGVWNAQGITGCKQVVLCEALLDALTFWCAGVRNVTASYGVEGFTEEHLALFKAGGVEEVLIAYDRDEAGELAAEALATRLMAEGLTCFRVQFPRGMDANEYALKVQPASKALTVALRQAQWMGKGNKRPLSLAALPPASGTQASASNPAPAEGGAGEPALEVAPVVEASAAPAPAPEPPEASPPAELSMGEAGEEELVVLLGERRYRVRGLGRNTFFDALRINVLCTRNGGQGGFHLDTLDLYSARQRQAFVKQAAVELRLNEEVLKADVGQLLLQLEALQEKRLKAALEPKAKVPAMSEEERTEALELLRSPKLLERVLEDFERCGVRGEETNKLMGYLAAVSRKLEEPLAVVIQSSSAAGKTSLMEAVLAFVPEEDKVQYSAMTGQSLFYMGDLELKHKVLAIAEEEGAARASYALKLLQSEGKLTIASTGKDPNTGRHVTHEYRVEGPAQLFLTTTAIEVDEELLNRCLVLTVDEDRAQTRAIHELQRARRTLEGRLAQRERKAVLALHQNAQRLLRPLPVVNPYATSLTFPDEKTRTRRDHQKYLTLIDAIAFLGQHQRPTKTVQHRGQQVEYVEVQLEDIATANRLAHQVLGRSLDELPPQTRRLLELLDAWLARRCAELAVQRGEFRFSRREAREALGVADTQLRLHLGRLEQLEYVVAHRGGKGQSFVYELAYDGQGKDGTPFLPGLLDVEKLAAQGYDSNLAGEKEQRAGASRPLRGPFAGRVRGPGNDEKPSGGAELLVAAAPEPGNAPLEGESAALSYLQV